MKYYKILNEQENHKGLQYHTGRVDDPVPFEEDGSCVPGGIYFAPVTSILAFIDYGPWIREVTVPDDAQVVRDPGKGPEKYRASSVVLGERERCTDPKVLQRLIDEGADVHAQEDIALRWAADNGHTETVKVILENGANVHANNDHALRWAARNGHTETVQVLLEAGASVGTNTNHPLRSAAKLGHTEIVRLLLGYGADIHARGDEALRWAAEYGRTDTVQLLLDYGADVHAYDGLALRWAARKGHMETVKVLKSHTENNS